MRFSRCFCIIHINDNVEPIVFKGGFTMKKSGIWKKLVVVVAAAALSAASVISVWAAAERLDTVENTYWSEESDTCYISEDYAELLKNGGKIDTDHSGPGVSGDSSAEVKETDTISVVYKAEWIPTADGRWWYRNSDGSYPAGGWWREPGTEIWYYFDAEGYMKTGWIEENGVKYYCQPSGAMVTGDQTIDGVLYHFDSSGALQQS